MPVDQVIICYLHKRNCINVLLLRSFDLFKVGTLTKTPCEMIQVAPNGISFSEQNLEYRILLDEFFELTIKSEDGEPLYGMGDLRANNVAFGLYLQRVNLRMLEQHTVDVKLGELPLRITSTAPCSFHCSNCANEVIRSQQYLRIQPVPVITMQPQSFFCGRHKIPVYPKEDQLFYGLNYVVICFLLLGNGVIRSWGRRHLECSRCRQVVGEVLGKDVAIQLHADALRVMTVGAGANSPVKFREIYGHVTATQLMIRLLHDAEPISPDKTRIFLKAVRPDGQLHFLQMLVDTHQLHVLRSQLPAPKELEHSKDDQKSPEERNSPALSDTSSEGDLEIKNSDTSSTSISSGFQDAEVDTVRPQATPCSASDSSQVLQATDGVSKPTISYVELRGFRGFRIRFLFSGTDQEMADNQEVLDQWHDEGAHELRVSYPMIMELLAELIANENIVTALEKLPAPTKTNYPRLSYVVYETDKDFYDRQQLPHAELDI
ncbi:hypothetical protein KR054_011523 [Drosophila jambulina]|nr:hypothetical protein KR054_011523 [Drosophila jambulina]